MEVAYGRIHEDSPVTVLPSIGKSRARAESIASAACNKIGSCRPVRAEGQVKYMDAVDCQSEVLCCKFNADGSMFAAGLANGSIKVYKTETSACIYELIDDDLRRDRLPCTSLYFLPSASMMESQGSQIIATYATGQVKLWYISTSSCLYTINENRQTMCSAIDASGDKYVTGGDDSKLYLYDMETKKTVGSLEANDSRDVMNGHRQKILAVKMHPTESHTIISGGWDDTVQIWDDRQQHAVRRIYGPHICGEALDIEPVHNHLMTGSWRKGHELQIWDLASGFKLKDVPQDAFHNCMLYCCQWLGQDHMICGGNEQNMVQIIDRGTLNTVSQLVDFEGGVFCLDHQKTEVSGSPKIIIGSAKAVHIARHEGRL